MLAGVALVTGASRGIGRAIALALASEGADLVGVGRDQEGLVRLELEIGGLGRRFLALATDLSQPGAAADVAERAWEWQGELTMLVNAAGILIRKPEAELTAEEFDRTFALNVRAPFSLLEAIGSRMYESAGGSVVNVASIAGEIVTGAPAPYQASKAALIQLTRFYAKKLAPKVRVNAVGPGYVRTDLSREWLAIPENEGWVVGHTPAGRVATPEDIAGPVAFLLSENASYITGQHVLVDGGWSVS